MQCHQIDKEGGIQGPSLSLVGDRLEPVKLLNRLLIPVLKLLPVMDFQQSVQMMELLLLVGWLRQLMIILRLFWFLRMKRRLS